MTTHVRLDHVDPEHARTFVVNWCVTSVCNYACSYCLETLHDHRVRFPEVATVVGLVQQVQAQRPGYRVALELTGGEVTAWPRLLECAAAVRERRALLSVLSNGSRPLEWWRGAAPLLDGAVLSFHVESARFEHFLQVVELLRRTIPLHVNVIMLPRLFTQCVAAARVLSALADVTVALQPLVKDMNRADSPLHDYTRDQLDVLEHPDGVVRPPAFTRPRRGFRGDLYLEDREGRRTVFTPQQMSAAGLNRWRGWACAMGVEQIAVYLDGSVYGGWCRQGGRLGSVHEQNVTLPHRATVCQGGVCTCYFDMQSRKLWTPLAEGMPGDLPAVAPMNIGV